MTRLRPAAEVRCCSLACLALHAAHASVDYCSSLASGCASAHCSGQQRVLQLIAPKRLGHSDSFGCLPKSPFFFMQAPASEWGLEWV